MPTGRYNWGVVGAPPPTFSTPSRLNRSVKIKLPKGDTEADKEKGVAVGRPKIQKASTRENTAPQTGSVVKSQLGATPAPPTGSALPITGAPGGMANTALGAAVGAAGAPPGSPPSVGTDLMGGFAGRYNTSTGPRGVYDNPDIVTRDVLASLGIPATGTMIGESGDFTDAMMQLVFLRQLAGKGGPTDEAAINELASLIGSGMQPGGRYADPREALGMLMEPGGSGTLLSQYLYGGVDPTTGQPVPYTLDKEMGALGPLYGGAISGMSPVVQQAMFNALAASQQGAQYDLARGQGGQHIADYLRKNLGGMVPGGMY